MISLRARLVAFGAVLPTVLLGAAVLLAGVLFERLLLAGVDEAMRTQAAVEAVTRGLVAKLLHGPSVRLKDDVGSPRGERNAAAVRDLFDLQ